MPVVRKRPLALAVLAEIWAFIAADSERGADRFLETVETRLALAASRPQMGRRRDELSAGLRSLVVGRYVAFYLVTDDGVDLVRFLHGSRDVARVIRGSGEPE